MNYISECCRASIGKGWKMEYPLGGSRFGQAHVVDHCESCGKEVDGVVEVTECCGEEVCECSEILITNTP